MAEFLKLNGIAVPVLVDGAEYEHQLLTDSARAESMALIENIEAEKGVWRFSLQPQTRANAFAFRQLINGAGHYWGFDAASPGVYSSRGLGPSALTNSVFSAGAAWLGAGKLSQTLSTGTVTWPALRPGSADGWTVMVARKVGAAAWGHHIVNSGEGAYFNGAFSGVSTPPWMTINTTTGTVKLDADAVDTTLLDELVILPFSMPAAWVWSAFDQQNPAGGNTQWSSLRQLKLQGDVLAEGGTKVVVGKVTREGIAPYVIGTFQPSARELEFELTEV